VEPKLGAAHRDHLAEDFDVADRGSFYDAVGAVRDVVQNHLLQVLGYLTNGRTGQGLGRGPA
jgi:glucose-6-phosphate 1-dehydrogenase